MRLGIVADIHANLLALDAVLADGDALGVEEWVCLGDVVGYGPDPHLCLQRLAERGVRSVMGNHEARLLGRPTARFNALAEAAIAHAARVIGAKEREQMEGFATSLEIEGEALFCHGSPQDRDEYLFSVAQLQQNLAVQQQPLVFFGHTHQQFVFDGRQAVTGPARVELGGIGPVLVNPGSVGQPRDGDPRAAYVVWDRDEEYLVLRRIEYDVPSQMQRSLDAGLPEHLALRLEAGR